MERRAAEGRVDRAPKAGDPGSYNQAWTDAGSRGYELLVVDGHLQWSLIHFWPGDAASVRARETAGTAAAPSAEPTVSDVEADEMEEHLRGLGYLE